MPATRSRLPIGALLFLPMGLVLAAGCEKPFSELPALDFADIPFDNALLTSSDAMVAAYDMGLACPDGQPARIFAVYREGITEAAPVAIVLHSGAFDYFITDEAEAGEAPSAPRTYRLQSRLTRQWSIAKVWETLGTGLRPVDPDESNQGALPVALADAGVVALYPANCWGDLWHGSDSDDNNSDDNDGQTPSASEGEVVRDGLSLAWLSVRLLLEGNLAAQEGFSLPVPIERSELYLVGLGEGGRGVGELLSIDGMPPVSGVLVDSTPDRLEPYLEDPLQWPELVAGIEDIYGSTDPAVVDANSLHRIASETGLPDHTGLAWSDIDPQLPLATIAPTAQALEMGGAWVWNAQVAEHIVLNGDEEAARAAVTFLLEGTRPSLD